MIPRNRNFLEVAGKALAVPGHAPTYRFARANEVPGEKGRGRARFLAYTPHRAAAIDDLQVTIDDTEAVSSQRSAKDKSRHRAER